MDETVLADRHITPHTWHDDSLARPWVKAWRGRATPT
jgi:hypothetical protein